MSSRPKVEKLAQMGKFGHILENAGSGCEGEIWRGEGDKTRIRPGWQVPCYATVYAQVAIIHKVRF